MDLMQMELIKKVSEEMDLMLEQTQDRMRKVMI